MIVRSILLLLPLVLVACSDSERPAGEPMPNGSPALSDSVEPPSPTETFLAANAARQGVAVTASGLQYEVLMAATGPRPGTESTVTMHYVGTLLDGTEFDNSRARDEPATVPLDGVIVGLTEGMQLMSVGSRYRFVLPADLAYGEAGNGSAIGPGATLIFDVELLEINS